MPADSVEKVLCSQKHVKTFIYISKKPKMLCIHTSEGGCMVSSVPLMGVLLGCGKGISGIKLVCLCHILCCAV